MSFHIVKRHLPDVKNQPCMTVTGACAGIDTMVTLPFAIVTVWGWVGPTEVCGPIVCGPKVWGPTFCGITVFCGVVLCGLDAETFGVPTDGVGGGEPGVIGVPGVPKNKTHYNKAKFCDNVLVTTIQITISNKETVLEDFSWNCEAFASEFRENLQEII